LTHIQSVENISVKKYINYIERYTDIEMEEESID